MPRTKTFDETVVLEKAMELFWKQGFAATSIQDLVDHLGINRASLYNTYGGKEELFQKSFARYRMMNRKALTHLLNQYAEVRQGIRALFEQAISASVADDARKGCFVVNTATEQIPGNVEMLGILQKNKKAIEEIFYAYLQKGVDQGQLSEDKDLRAIASLLFTLYNGLKVVSKVEPEDSRLTQSVHLALTLLD